MTLKTHCPFFPDDENHEIISSVTDEYGYPNTDIKGADV